MSRRRRLRILLKAALQQLAHARRRRRRQRVPIRLAVRIAAIVGDRLARKRAPARQHLEEHAAERPDVGALVDGLPRACSGLMYAAVPRITPVARVLGTVIVGEC